jgi:hypothetical protein
MKNLSELLEESKNEILFEADEQQGDDQNQDQKNKPVKGDAGTFKVWKPVSCTMRGWLKTMSGQEEVKDSFFEGGFLVPMDATAISTDANVKSATLSKQLDTSVKCTIVEYKNNFSFYLFGTKPGYVSSGWNTNSGGGISTIVKNLTANSQQKQEQNQDKGNDNTNNGTM